MRPLKDVIASLRREIELGLQDSDRPPREGVRIEANRVTVQLAVAVSESRSAKAEGGLAFQIESPSHNGAIKSPSPVTVTLEFQIIGSSVVAPAGPMQGMTAAHEHKSKPPASGPQPLPVERRSAVIEILSKVFGPPGFDSSARSTVFCETLADLSEEEVLTVIASLDDAPRPGLVPVIKHARHLLTGILRSGPLRSARAGGELLAEMFLEFETGSLVRLIRETWKTQEHWLGNS